MTMSELVPPSVDALAGVQAVLIVGFARTGQAVARVLRTRNLSLRVLDDRPDAAAREEAARLGIELIESPGPLALARLIGDADLVVASPGVPPSHPALGAAPANRLVSEVELAARLSPVPLIAITGTNGKTTVTSLVAAMLAASGRNAPAAGNIGRPLIDAVLAPGVDLVVAEVSSFQLLYTRDLRPTVAAYLNFAEDHLDWHGDARAYAEAKAKIFARQGQSDVAVANAEDEVVMQAARAGRARVVTFGLERGDFHLDGDRLLGPDGTAYAHLTDLPRALPHDVQNALAALAIARDAGADAAACRQALRTTTVLAHRVELVVEHAGVAYYDDSKATTPSAVAAALRGFAGVVLIAGGRNKGLDLTAMRAAAVDGGRRRVRAVVAIGEAAEEVAAAFAGYPVERATSMRDAVRAARALVRPGEVVLLSPGCASFDWYRSYEERGADFARIVRAEISGEA